jgi:hypothetical protein
MLVDLETFLGIVPGDQLDLGIGEPFGRQEGQHLMTEQMRMHELCDARLLAGALLGALLQMAFEDKAKARGKQDVAASGAFAAQRRGGMSTCWKSMISPKSCSRIPSVSSPQN